ncbi:siderophore-interacting protein [Schumannella luteola]|uniref:NADPH-dependent ferric siderophore reductase n=1 Tax=Schumannella luteola TaxID=472059 RepID=A0A852Y4T4_9MICO|nr:siderophore-interacting protein [Schumannella luteola]NYG97936.1 NADPH-dependent ferric siderophore reductase [Schumannella luteola]TPX03071.1 siderophore-interacting protein [Schumannella luteola]
MSSTTPPPRTPADTATPAGTSAAPVRPRGSQHALAVTSSERLSPHLVRLRFGGEGVAAWIAAADPARLTATDTYAKLLFAKPELGLEPPYDLEVLRERLPLEDLPVRRTYTIREVDAAAATLAIDFVVHGDEGVAGPWALAAQPGDVVSASTPGGAFAPSDDATLPRLYLGDDSAIPAIAAALEALPADAHGTAIIEVDSAAEELPLTHPEGVDLTWLHRLDDTDAAAPAATAGELLVAAARALPAPTGPVEVFAHGERGAMKELRRLINGEWGVDRALLSLSAYWALGRAEDAFQAEKREPIGQIFDA